MSEMIDRDEVIEIIESVCSTDDTYWKPGTLEKIRNLSTHQTPSNTLGALDCVSRQDAINAICSVCGNDCDKSKFLYDAPQDDQIIICPEHYVLTQLPSVQPRKGLWINGMCSECEESTQGFLTNFCPNCGSYNGGE